MTGWEQDELKQLSSLAGKWLTEGEVLATPSSPPVTIKGTDSYAWVCGGKFLLHRADVLIGDEHVEVIEMIGYDVKTKMYPMHSFDNQGNVTTMHSTTDLHGVWKIHGQGIRSTLIVSEDGHHMKALWERSDDGVTWLPWMDMKFTRA